jgi:hypothetical protein
MTEPPQGGFFFEATHARQRRSENARTSWRALARLPSCISVSLDKRD